MEFIKLAILSISVRNGKKKSPFIIEGKLVKKVSAILAKVGKTNNWEISSEIKKLTIPAGGQIEPFQIDGSMLEWKNAQKNEAKNITSETINSIKPSLRLPCTNVVWYPI